MASQRFIEMFVGRILRPNFYEHKPTQFVIKEKNWKQNGKDFPKKQIQNRKEWCNEECKYWEKNKALVNKHETLYQFFYPVFASQILTTMH